MQLPAQFELAQRLPPPGCSLAEAERYTRWLATSHYENFNVVSWLLPRHLHQHCYNVYAYCRWADDLGDEVSDPALALQLLGVWEQELRSCYAGKPSHPVFIALWPTIQACEIPLEPFSDLLVAFRQDQTVRRYPDWNSLLEYSRYSANPVGRLVLSVCGYRDEERQKLSDATCTALQLTNHWQDVSRDLDKGRIYIPQDAMAVHGLTESDIVGRHFDTRYAALMKDLISRTRELFAQGMPLAGRVEGALRVDIEMFSRGGLAVLEAIEAAGYNTLQRRSAISKTKQVRLLTSALVRRWFTSSGMPAQGAAGPQTRLAIVSGGCLPSPLGGQTRTANGAEVAQSYSECRRVARGAASNFYYAFFMLPQAKRDALCALYAFLRLVDDVSDSLGDIAEKQRGLSRWRAALDAAAAGDTAAHPILPAFADTMQRFKIPPRYFHDLISGAEMDLTVGSYATFDRLREYCYRVAGTVGLTCLQVFQYEDPHAPALAEKLGIAFQLTNILRDIPKDFEMGRVYLPDEDLAQFGVRREQLAHGPVTPPLRAMLAFEAGRAWEFYREGVELIPRVHQNSRAALWALVRIYSRLLRRIEARGYDVFAGRVRVGAPEKTGILLRARLGWYSEQNVLEERDRDRRRLGGSVRGRRAG